MRALDIIGAVAFITALIVLPFSFWWFLRRPLQSLAAFALPLLIAGAASDMSQRLGQATVLDQLDALTGEYQISINSVVAPNPAEVLSVLKTLRRLPKHHSSPTQRLNVEISDGSRRIALQVCRDSGNPREYWVFYPKYRITRGNEIGSVITSIFDSY